MKDEEIEEGVAEGVVKAFTAVSNYYERKFADNDKRIKELEKELKRYKSAYYYVEEKLLEIVKKNGLDEVPAKRCTSELITC